MTRFLVGFVLFLVAGVLILCNAGMIFLSVPSLPGVVVSAVAAFIPAVGFVFLVLRLDRFEHEPLFMVGLAFFWGALVATILAFIANTIGGVFLMAIFGNATGDFLTAGVIAPVVEETVKGFAILLLVVFFRREFDNTLDGILYGSLIGLGFAMTENVLYFGRTFVQEGPIGLGLLFYLRVILGGFGHAIYTGTTGAGIGIARESRSFLGVLVAVIFFALAIAQHAAWNTIAATFIPGLVDDSAGGVLALLFVIFPITAVVFQAPGFIGLLALATWSSRREARIIMEHLRPELADGVITEAEYRVIGRGLVRSMTEFGTLVSRGPGAWLRQRQLHQLATELAFSRYHRARGEFADTAPATEQSYRDRIRALRPA